MTEVTDNSKTSKDGRGLYFHLIWFIPPKFCCILSDLPFSKRKRILGSCLWYSIVFLSLSHVVSWARCGTWLYRFLIFAAFLNLLISTQYVIYISWSGGVERLTNASLIMVRKRKHKVILKTKDICNKNSRIIIHYVVPIGIPTLCLHTI